MSKLLIALSLLFTMAVWQETYAVSNKNLEKEIGSYFNSFNTLRADFTEEANGHVRTGRMVIQKPKFGKIEYLQPDKTLVIVKGNRVILYDFKLKEFANIAAPPGFFKGLLSIKDSADYTIKETKDNVTVSFSVNDESSQTGKVNILIELRRIKGELQLKSLSFDDGFASPITVKLSNIQLNAPVKRSEFEFNNPNFFKK